MSCDYKLVKPNMHQYYYIQQDFTPEVITAVETPGDDSF